MLKWKIKQTIHTLRQISRRQNDHVKHVWNRWQIKHQLLIMISFIEKSKYYKSKSYQERVSWQLFFHLWIRKKTRVHLDTPHQREHSHLNQMNKIFFDSRLSLLSSLGSRKNLPKLFFLFHHPRPLSLTWKRKAPLSLELFSNGPLFSSLNPFFLIKEPTFVFTKQSQTKSFLFSLL